MFRHTDDTEEGHPAIHDDMETLEECFPDGNYPTPEEIQEMGD